MVRSAFDDCAVAMQYPSNSDDYYRIRDFEYAQPLYDLAFLLEVSAIANRREIPKYRTLALFRAAYSLDGYGTNIDQWLDSNNDTISDVDLDYIPSLRIRKYLSEIRRTGTIEQLHEYSEDEYAACLRLRSIRGLGPQHIASLFHLGRDEWLRDMTVRLGSQATYLAEAYDGSHAGIWQTAHVVPPLLRFLRAMERAAGKSLTWNFPGVTDPLQPITAPVVVCCRGSSALITKASKAALEQEKFFRLNTRNSIHGGQYVHHLGWSFIIEADDKQRTSLSIEGLANLLDPTLLNNKRSLKSDLHCHTVWSDGNASVPAMAEAMVRCGLQYFAITDHSRSCKLQGGLTPITWSQQAAALSIPQYPCPILHGIEVDILTKGSLDMPHSLLAAADIVIGSVHSAWSSNAATNTRRLANAVETGLLDILAHPTSALVGKPGVPNYLRMSAAINWEELFELCSQWWVALEFNCFPSRLDLSVPLLQKAIDAGCAISIGSDAHARSHLLNLGFGEAVLQQVNAGQVLNYLSYDELMEWIRESRSKRQLLRDHRPVLGQTAFSFESSTTSSPTLYAQIRKPERVPAGSRVVGIDLTAGAKATGLACLDGMSVQTNSLHSDEEIISYIQTHKPNIVSIDSPLGLPGGGRDVNPHAGIVRVAENDLASIGIPAYPALIDSMKKLTLRGIKLREAIEQLPDAPQVIESYPGAAQDVLCIPRKQKSLDALREGLRQLGLDGTGLETKSHDEMDAITSAIVGRYYESNRFEPMGIPSEAQLIVPKVSPLIFHKRPIICLTGKTGAGKSVVARYLSVFYGFMWIRTRDVIRDLLKADQAAPAEVRMYTEPINVDRIIEQDLRQFGALILNEYQQKPLQQHLTKTVAGCASPVVIDSIREITDVDQSVLSGRPILIWFIQSPNSQIRRRLAEKRKLGQKRLEEKSPVDRVVPQVRSISNTIISNSGSLEDLRARVDDALWRATEIVQTTGHPSPAALTPADQECSEQRPSSL